MEIIIIGAAGFIGTNLFLSIIKNNTNSEITLVDDRLSYFDTIMGIKGLNTKGVKFKVIPFEENADYSDVLKEGATVFHLASTNIPGNSNNNISSELFHNINASVKLLDSCVKYRVERIIFISSGGAIYGKEGCCPHNENDDTFPISSYGIQKLTIEKLLYMYHDQFGLDYRVIRLSNPYGPYQRPDGRLGVISTFVYHALTDGHLNLFGDGSVVRDYIYIDDAMNAILKVAFNNSRYTLYNVGSGIGTNINEIIDYIKESISKKLIVNNMNNRSMDIPVNYLDIKRITNEFGKIYNISIKDGIQKTADFMRDFYNI